MSEKPLSVIALTADSTVRNYGYETGVGHVVWIEAESNHNDPLAYDTDGKHVTLCGKSLETKRLIEKFTGDAVCKQCAKRVTNELFDAAYADKHSEGDGETVAEMIASDPDATIITPETALEEKAAKKAETAHAEAVKVAEQAKSERKNARKAACATAPVKCTETKFRDYGDGTGVCKSCGWRGPVKEVKEPVLDYDGKVVREPVVNKNGKKTGKMRDKFNLSLAMTAHWVAGNAPVSVELGEQKTGPDAPMSENPVTEDKGNRSADDMLGGNRAGMMPGHTSLTRGGAMNADKVTGPTGRGTHKTTGESLPRSTTVDKPNGSDRIDKRSAELTYVGGLTPRQWSKALTPEQFNGLSRTAKRRYLRNAEVARTKVKGASPRKGKVKGKGKGK